MTGCTVENNTAQGSIGGGLYNNFGSSTLIDCVLRGNTADQGGGIYSENMGATVILHGTRVTGNTATNGGSGIYNRGSSSTVTLLDGSTVCANDPTADQCDGVTDPDGGCQLTCPTP